MLSRGGPKTIFSPFSGFSCCRGRCPYKTRVDMAASILSSASDRNVLSNQDAKGTQHGPGQPWPRRGFGGQFFVQDRRWYFLIQYNKVTSRSRNFHGRFKVTPTSLHGRSTVAPRSLHGRSNVAPMSLQGRSNIAGKFIFMIYLMCWI